MAIFKISDDNGAKTMVKVEKTTFEKEQIYERKDLQQLLCKSIHVIDPDIMVINDEFDGFKDSNRRIDILGLDNNGDIVVIELKRTEDGGHADLQAIRYAAMVSTMTFKKAVETYEKYLKKNQSTEDAEGKILRFLGPELKEDDFAQSVRIILASADFSQELTTAVLWLNKCGLNIRSIRLEPYKDGDNIFLNIQQIIPLPEAEDYQIRLKEKVEEEKKAKDNRRHHPEYLFSSGIVTEDDIFCFRDDAGKIYEDIQCKLLNSAGPSGCCKIRLEEMINGIEEIEIPKWEDGKIWVYDVVEKIPFELPTKGLSQALHRKLEVYDDATIGRKYGMLGDDNFVRKSDGKSLEDLRKK